MTASAYRQSAARVLVYCRCVNARRNWRRSAIETLGGAARACMPAPAAKGVTRWNRYVY